jgi:Cu/Ag efflux protein CusF
MQDFRLQDGLLLDALRYGDKVTFTTTIVNGAKTITSLKKE